MCIFRFERKITIEKETLKQKLSAAAAREDEERKKEKLQHAATKAVP